MPDQQDPSLSEGWPGQAPEEQRMSGKPQHYATPAVQAVYEAGASIRVLATATGKKYQATRRGLMNTGVQLRVQGHHGHHGWTVDMATEALANVQAVLDEDN
jgi:hypothetical protein